MCTSRDHKHRHGKVDSNSQVSSSVKDLVDVNVYDPLVHSLELVIQDNACRGSLQAHYLVIMKI